MGDLFYFSYKEKGNDCFVYYLFAASKLMDPGKAHEGLLISQREATRHSIVRSTWHSLRNSRSKKKKTQSNQVSRSHYWCMEIQGTEKH